VTRDVTPPLPFETPPLAPLAKGLMILQATYLALTLPLYPLYGLSIGALGSLAMVMGLLGGFAALWLFYRYVRKGRDAWLLSEVVCVIFLMMLFTNVASPSQYLAVAMGMPLIDPWLAGADEALGIHVPSLTAWTAERPLLATLLKVSYHTLKLQFIGAVIVLGIVYKDLERLWEYAFHFHFCLLVTALSLAFFPAECAFTYYGFESLLDQARFIGHFEGFRSGAQTVIHWDELEGLISMPSFHVAGGLMVTWVLRGFRFVFLVAVVLNVLMIAATVMCGAHYFIDLVATIALFALSVFCYRRWGVGRWNPTSA
jgi:hypothetical protein